MLNYNSYLILSHLCCIILLVWIAVKLGKGALQSLFFLFILIANLFATKEIHFLNLTIPTCDVYTVGSILCLNLLQEIYGRKISKKCLYAGAGMMAAFLLMSLFHLAYIPTKHSIHFSEAFDLILAPAPRIFISSLVAIVASDSLDRQLFQFFKNKFPNLPFVSRFVGSTVISQFFDTFIVSFGALYGIIEKIWDFILVSYSIKIFFILLQALFFLFPKKSFYKKKDFI